MWWAIGLILLIGLVGTIGNLAFDLFEESPAVMCLLVSAVLLVLALKVA